MNAILAVLALFAAYPGAVRAAGPAPEPGAPLWVGRQPAGNEGAASQGRGVALDAGGNILVTGFTLGPDGNYDALTCKYSPYGDLVWSRTYDYSWNDIGTAVASDPDGNVVVAGTSQNLDNPSDIYLSAYYTDYLLLKYGPGGELIFDTSVSGNGKNNVPAAVCTDRQGGIYVTGAARDATDTHDAYYTVKFAPSGEPVWERVEDWGSEASATGIGLCRDRVVVAGSVWDAQELNYDITVVVYTADSGDIVEISTYKTPGKTYDETASGLAVGPDCSSYITGRTSDSEGVALTVRLDPALKPMWAEPLYLYGGGSRGVSVGMDERGRVYVAGGMDAEPGRGGQLLAVYGPDGRLAGAREIGPEDGFTVEDMAVEPDGDIVLTGTTFEDGSADTMTTARLAGYPEDAPKRFDLEDEFIRREDVSLAWPPVPMLRRVVLTERCAMLYGCLPAHAFVAEPVGISGEYEYSFYVTRGDGLTWELVREYSPVDFWILPPVPDKGPVTGVMVQVRPAGSTMAYQAREWVNLDRD